MKYLKPEMTVLILEAEHVIRTSVTSEADVPDIEEQEGAKAPTIW